MKKIVIVGAGSWSREMHLPVLQRIRSEGRADYAAVCDLDPAKAEAYAAALGAEAHTDLTVMVSRVRPDGLVLLAPPAATSGLIEFCVARHLPFLAEKPAAPDAATHRRLLDVAGSLPHIVAFNRRHAPYVRQALAWMQDVSLQGVACDFSRYNRRGENFGATFVHGLDAVQCLAKENFTEAHLVAAPVDGAVNLYVGGWTASGVRLELRITPTTGSAREHYTLISTDRSVVLAYPQPPMIDLPGRVELHERNRVVASRTPADFGLAPDDLPGLSGILGEHARFIDLLEGTADASWSTLATSLPTQILRDALSGMSALRTRTERRIVLDAAN
jgi:predicted dehydrogenase